MKRIGKPEVRHQCIRLNSLIAERRILYGKGNCCESYASRYVELLNINGMTGENGHAAGGRAIRIGTPYVAFLLISYIIDARFAIDKVIIPFNARLRFPGDTEGGVHLRYAIKRIHLIPLIFYFR